MIVAMAMAGLFASALPAAMLTGTVVDAEDKPIKAARVCYMVGGAELLCAETDENGLFELQQSQFDRIRIAAPGYLPRVVAAVNQAVPIALDDAAALQIRLKNGSTGEFLVGGEVFLIFPSGRRKGPFPHERSLLIRTLPPGKYRLLAKLEGYTQRKSQAVTLEARKQRAVEIALSPDEPQP